MHVNYLNIKQRRINPKIPRIRVFFFYLFLIKSYTWNVAYTFYNWHIHCISRILIFRKRCRGLLNILHFFWQKEGRTNVSYWYSSCRDAQQIYGVLIRCKLLQMVILKYFQKLSIMSKTKFQFVSMKFWINKINLIKLQYSL